MRTMIVARKWLERGVCRSAVIFSGANEVRAYSEPASGDGDLCCGCCRCLRAFQSKVNFHLLVILVLGTSTASCYDRMTPLDSDS
jgi:hypothetical protein